MSNSSLFHRIFESQKVSLADWHGKVFYQRAADYFLQRSEAAHQRGTLQQLHSSQGGTPNNFGASFGHYPLDPLIAIRTAEGCMRAIYNQKIPKEHMLPCLQVGLIPKTPQILTFLSFFWA